MRSDCGKDDVWGTWPHTCAYNGGTKMYLVNAEIIYGEKCAPKQRYVTICTRMVNTIVFAQAGVYTPAVIATCHSMLKNLI